jgi:hypothetical protein
LLQQDVEFSQTNFTLFDLIDNNKKGFIDRIKSKNITLIYDEELFKNIKIFNDGNLL